MKNRIIKTLMTFLLSFVTLTTFAQSSDILYLRAHTVSMGTRVTSGEPIEWIVDGKEVNILIEAHQNKVTIHSQKLQTYYVINKESDEQYKKVWKCKNLDGLTCFVKIQSDPKYPGLMALEIEFDDMMWFYICSAE